jgi:enterochelin esterase family protein
VPVEIHELESQVLVDNPLGDPTRRRVPVYLPPGYHAGKQRYPLLIALAGFTGTGMSYLNYDFYQPNLPERLDACIGSGEMAPCIVVMADGMTRLGGNQYIDSSAVGPWGTHVADELVPWAEATFRCLGGRDHRGVFGKSSGGYGALMMGLLRSDVFGAIASHSGDCYFEYAYWPFFPRAVQALRRAGGLDRWMRTWRDHDKLPGWSFPLMEVIAMAAFYSPDPAAKHGFVLPFDPETGEMNVAVFERWRRLDPVNLVAERAEALKSLRLFFFDCGEQDEYHLQHGARILAKRLREAGVEHQYEPFDDGHRSVGYRYRASLPLLARSVT